MNRRRLRVTEPAVRWEDVASLREVIESGWLTGGPKVRAFEEGLGAFLGVAHVVACSSGTAALQLALEACGLGPGMEVLVPAFTFPATANAVERAGARAVPVDIDLSSFNMDVGLAEDAVGRETRAILPVHQFGMPADMGKIEGLSARHGLALIEDAACALGATHGGRKCGTVGRAGCFSFHPRKVLTTGEGGAVVTAEAEIAATCRELRNHGLAAGEGLDFRLCGDNRRMSDVHAALGLPQLARLEAALGRRSELARRYGEGLRDVADVRVPATPANGRHVWQSYVVLLGDSIERQACMHLLQGRGIETVVPGRAIHVLPYYRARYGFAEEDFPNAARAGRSALALPLFAAMSNSDVERVVESLRAVLQDERARQGRAPRVS